MINAARAVFKIMIVVAILGILSILATRRVTETEAYSGRGRIAWTWFGMRVRTEPRTDELQMGSFVTTGQPEVWVVESKQGIWPGMGGGGHLFHSGAAAAHYYINQSESEGRLSSSQAHDAHIAVGRMIMTHPVVTVNWDRHARLIAHSLDGSNETLVTNSD